MASGPGNVPGYSIEQRTGRGRRKYGPVSVERKVHAIGPALKNKSIYLIFQAERRRAYKNRRQVFGRLPRRTWDLWCPSIRQGTASIMQAIEEQKMLHTFLLDNGY